MTQMSEKSVKRAEAGATPVKREEGWWETVKVIIEALLIALVVRTLLFQPFNIPSGSLVPTLLVGDYLFVSKYAYGYSHFSLPGFLDLDPSAMPGRIFASQPKRGDIIVFKLPSDGQTDYIKRLIGLPGDKIQVTHGRLIINGETVPREPIAALCDDQPLRQAGGGPALHRDAARRRETPDHPDRRRRRHLRQHQGLRSAARPLLHDGRQPRQFRAIPASPPTRAASATCRSRT